MRRPFRTTRVSRWTGWLLVALSLALHLVTLYTYSRQPDRFAAFTVMPIWVWGGIGLACSVTAYWFLRAPLSLVLSGVWTMTVLLGADEARSIARWGGRKPEPGPAGKADGRPLLRVATLNCNFFGYTNGADPTDDLAEWEPDIVLLQEVHPNQTRLIADRLFDGTGDYRNHRSNGIATRWKITREVRNLKFRDQQLTLRLPDGREIEVLNLHLASAATDLRLWERQCWRTHRENRRRRGTELSAALSLLAQTDEGRPAIVGGDFNSPPGDPILRLLKADFDDAFAEAGGGWGNTYQRRIPLLRIDQIHASRQFRPHACTAVTTRHSDHRIVVADFLLAP